MIFIFKNFFYIKIYKNIYINIIFNIVFFSPYKFIGGPNIPGVLIIHNRITMNTLKPTQAGGGTVNYVYKGDIDYSLDVEDEEESGTLNIIGGIRVGLMTYIRSKIDHNLIIDIDEEYNKTIENINEPNIYILENELLKGKPYIPVFSFLISYGDKFIILIIFVLY